MVPVCVNFIPTPVSVKTLVLSSFDCLRIRSPTLKNCEVKNDPDTSKTAPEFSLIPAVNLKEELENKALLILFELIVSVLIPWTGLSFF